MSEINLFFSVLYYWHTCRVNLYSKLNEWWKFIPIKIHITWDDSVIMFVIFSKKIFFINLLRSWHDILFRTEFYMLHANSYIHFRMMTGSTYLKCNNTNFPFRSSLYEQRSCSKQCTSILINHKSTLNSL